MIYLYLIIPLLIAIGLFLSSKRNEPLFVLKRNFSVLFFIYGLILFSLSNIWYDFSKSSNFHWFNDGLEWMYLDKFGHAWSTYAFTRVINFLIEPYNFLPKQRFFVLFLTGPILWSGIELLDGFFPTYGASYFDIMANFSGAIIFLIQHHFFKTIKFPLKFGFSPSAFSHLRPNMLGDNYLTSFFKDYNGHTYWINIPIKGLKFLCISIGYGADGLIGGHSNQFYSSDNRFHDYTNIERVQQFYLSFDIDLDQIEVNSRLYVFIRGFLNSFRIPFPAIELNMNEGIKFHFIKF